MEYPTKQRPSTLKAAVLSTLVVPGGTVFCLLFMIHNSTNLLLYSGRDLLLIDLHDLDVFRIRVFLWRLVFLDYIDSSYESFNFTAT